MNAMAKNIEQVKWRRQESPTRLAVLYFTPCLTSVACVLFGKLPLLFATDCKLFLDLDRKTKPVSDKTRCTIPLF